MPTPAAEQTDTGGSLADRYPALAAEWEPTRNGILVPEFTAPGSKRPVWWVCSKCQYVWQARVSSRTRGHGCPACARRASGKARSAPRPGESLAEKFPAVAADWHPIRNDDLTPSDVGYASNEKVWWQCRVCHYQWERQVCGRTQHGSSCPQCARTTKAVPKAGNSLAERCPSVAAEWHPTRNGDLTPADVSFSRKEKVWWKCAGCGHEWLAVIGNRVRWPGCPSCGRNGRKRLTTDLAAKDSDRQRPKKKRTPAPAPAPGRSFAERFPEIAAEWHPTRNDELTPEAIGFASNRRAWWICSTCENLNGQLSSIAVGRGAGCPECGRRRGGHKKAVPKPGNLPLSKRFPDIAAEWHTKRNQPVRPEQVAAQKPSTSLVALPHMGEHEWEAPVYSRANGFGCKALRHTGCQPSSIAHPNLVNPSLSVIPR